MLLYVYECSNDLVSVIVFTITEAQGITRIFAPTEIFKTALQLAITVLCSVTDADSAVFKV
jgi:hypothetical protein